MPAVHDRGGWPGAGPIRRAEHEIEDWEWRTAGVYGALCTPEKGVMRVDEMRRAIESLPRNQYESLRYYELRIAGLELLLIEKGMLTKEEVDQQVTQLSAAAQR